jgi:predicted 3-demethylubiquinone-9 3-methyltransferase (glyoxalase superfamily)
LNVGNEENHADITPFLWFNQEAEAAAKFYTSIFKKSKLGHVARYGDADWSGVP